MLELIINHKLDVNFVKLKFSELCSIDCTLKNIVASHSVWTTECPWNYEAHGRPKNLLYYQIENERHFSSNNNHICSAQKNDVVFIPHGTKYSSVNPCGKISTEIGISFDIFSADNELIILEEPLQIIKKDLNGQIYQRFKKVLFSTYHSHTHSLMIKGELFSLLDLLFSSDNNRTDFREMYGDIFEAINTLEKDPSLNLSNAQLAEMCFMSEASFLRKFKQYSGGISPLKYRNHIRLMKAEELINASYSVDEIANMLGFYDAAHLCRIYKRVRGHSLKRRV